VRIGELGIKVLRKHFYCRYCSSETECERRRKHRRGIAYVIQVRARNIAKQFIISDGEFEELNEFETLLGDVKRVKMSGATIYKHGYKTCGGWFSLTSRELDQSEYFEPEEVEYDEITFAKVLDEHKIMILTSLVRDNKEILELDWGVWNAVKPIIKTYVSDRTYHLPLNAYIFFQPFSFRALFRLRNIEIPVVKARPVIIYYDECTRVIAGKTQIWYYADPHKAVVLLNKNGEAYRYVQHEHTEPTCERIDPSVLAEGYLTYDRVCNLI
jgi:hypothetical protein